MKTVSKKLLSIMLAAILLVSAIPFQAFATESEEEQGTVEAGAIVSEGEGALVTGEPVVLTGNEANTGTGTETPAAGTETPAAGTETPAAGAEIPAAGTETPAAGAEIPAAGAEIPAAGAEIPAAGAEIPAAGAETPAAGTETNVSGTGSPVTSDPAAGGSVVPPLTYPHDKTHQLSGWKNDSTSHWRECLDTGCEAYKAGTPIDPTPHDWSKANGECLCGYKCTHPSGFVDKPGTYKAPTCIHEGKEFDKYCPVCNLAPEDMRGDVLLPTGNHSYDANGLCTTKGCGAQKDENEVTLTLDANGGKVNGGNTMGVSVKKNHPISVMPAPVREGFNFVGWFEVDQSGNMTNRQLRVGQNYPYDSGVTVMAKWAEKTQVLTVRVVFNGDNSTAETIYTANVPEGTPLLDYLKANVAPVVQAKQLLSPGYTWENKYFRDYSGKQPLTSQKDTMNQAQTVYVNFVSNSYRLYFDANGGTVSRTSQAVTFGKKVGELPTPFKDGSVFMGWKDASGKVYTAKTVYKVAGDTSLTAMWQDEALVILYIYVNGDFSTCNRMIAMDQYVVKNNISRSDVFAEVAKYYTPASGTLKIAGLFDENTWSSYRLNTSKAGTENIEVNDQHLNKIFVMVSNANTGTTVLPTTPSNTVPANGFWVRDLNGNLTWYPAGSKLPAGTGYWVLDSNGNPNIWVMTSGSIIPTYIYVGSNPKTGDTAKIEIAAAIMVLAAAALVTVMALRKKKKSV